METQTSLEFTPWNFLQHTSMQLKGLLCFFFVLNENSMFSKLFTPPKQPRKAQLSDFLKPASSFFGDITPPSSPAQTFVERVSFTPSPLATTAHHSEEFSTNENEQTAHPSNCSCCPTCTREPEGNSNPKKHGPTTFSQLRSRFQDRQYSVNLIYTQTGHGRRGKDCTCGNQGCKLRFQS